MTFDEARMMARVNARAEALFGSGYRARWSDPARLSVRNAGGTAYLVETRAWTCECPFFQAHRGRYPCKHLLGWPRLLGRQRSYRQTLSVVLGRLLDDEAGKDVVAGGDGTGSDAIKSDPPLFRFPPGRVVATPDVLRALVDVGVAPGGLPGAFVLSGFSPLGCRGAPARAVTAAGRYDLWRRAPRPPDVHILMPTSRGPRQIPLFARSLTT